ncbi:integrase [Methylovorus sp. MM2]|uniref:phage integrase n=1 Tax=Methylovorus sp. MM2 TaxID=1848038 RepID=UPI0007E1AD6D|nr:tyrosine-type recombinase/integrase [Methylovorus sp. MM2]OAM53078.1 integrase [Methylovorus sp. MM2]
MAITKTDKGWHVDEQPAGRGGKRYRKTFSTKAEALAFQAWLKTKVNQSPEWAPAKRDMRRLIDLIEIWHQHHGATLRAGKDTYSRLKTLCEVLGNPFLDHFKASTFAEYRKSRIEAGIAPNTLNREHAYLRSVFNEAKRLGYWTLENPLSNVRQIKVAERELSYLSKEEIREILHSLEISKSDDALLVAKICLSTGSRWSEAQGLRCSQVRDGQIHFSNTKSGKNRSVPISDDLSEELQAQSLRKGGSGQLFNYCYGAFRKAINRTDISLPAGQMTHVLRHTFASHFMMNNGNILVLQRLLGHSSLTMTMRYAHLSPDHLQEAKTKNPLATL